MSAPDADREELAFARYMRGAHPVEPEALAPAALAPARASVGEAGRAATDVPKPPVVPQPPEGRVLHPDMHQGPRATPDSDEEGRAVAAYVRRYFPGGLPAE